MATDMVPVSSAHAPQDKTLKITPGDAALRLLGAVPFTLTLMDDQLVWENEASLCALLKTRPERTPQSQAEYATLLSDDVQTFRRRAINSLSQDQSRYNIAYQIKAMDGSVLWIEERGMRLEGRGTMPTKIQGVLRDVTVEKRAKMRSAFQAHAAKKALESPTPVLPAAQTASTSDPKTISTTDVIAAVKDQTLTLAYQPIVMAGSKNIHHYECLLRRMTPEGELVSAADYVIAAEKCGLIHLLDKRALSIGIKTLRENPNIHLAFNISGGTIEAEFAMKNYLQTLESLGDDAKRVTLELTETLALEDDTKAAEFSEKVRALGCRFAIDDFGAGQTTFANLVNIKADIIKIDGSMIRDFAASKTKQSFVRILVDMAKTFGSETVAEMVSTHEDAAMLEAIGVTYFQSYIFGKPGPLNAVN